MNRITDKNARQRRSLRLRLRGLLVAAIVAGWAPPVLADGAMSSSPFSAGDAGFADRVVVIKSERKLHLLRGDEIMRSYPISLGQSPVGRKQMEGDNRTPEGEYMLDWRNANSDYYLAMHVSYPNDDDIRQARKKGVSPGNMIMIHGLPNDSEPSLSDYLGGGWTNGCIAVSNQAMIDIWLSVKDNTPITILP